MGTHGIKPEYMDSSANPGADFYAFANGGYVKSTKLPPGYARWGSFDQLAELSRSRIHEMMVAASTSCATPGSIEQKMGDFYASGMNEEKIEADGAAPLAEEFAAIKKVKTLRNLVSAVCGLHTIGVDAFFSFGSSQSFQDSSRMIAALQQSGIGMGERDYYLDTDDASLKKQRLYEQHVTNMFVLLGDSPRTASRNAASVVEIETALAAGMMESSQMRDPKNIDHVISVNELRELVPSFSFDAYFLAIGAPRFDSLNVMQPEFFKAFEQILRITPISELRAYLRWRLIDSSARFLSSAFVEERFSFFGKVMSGLTEMQPRYKRVIATVDGALGEGIGKLYVEKYFPAEAKTRVLSMIEDGKAEMRAAIENATWLSSFTRTNLLAKIDKTVWKIGYPDQWQDFSELSINRDSYLANAINASFLAHLRDMDKIGKPRDPNEWYMTPQTVNAYADPQSNEVVFPAAILQPPFFDFEADDAANYGGILVVILHEFGHLFDDSGANYDADGNVTMQWSDEDFAHFMTLVQKIRTQFGRLTVGKNQVPVKGDLVSGEAAADLNGVNLAYRALMRRLQETGRQTVDGFTDEQRFFIAFAQLWAGICTDEYLEAQVKGDPHPPGIFRVNATLANVPEFAEAFGLPANAPIMLPERDRCHIW